MSAAAPRPAPPTPGPWRALQHPTFAGLLLVCAGPGETLVAKVHRRADAELMAAAPELRDALLALLNHEAAHTGIAMDFGRADAVKAARAALAKASPMKHKTIADAPAVLNTNDRAMWVLGWNAAQDAREPDPADPFDGRHFYELCQQYRHAPGHKPAEVSDAFEALKTFARAVKAL